MPIFSKQRLEQIKTSKVNETFLLSTGLPEYCAPHLYFGKFDNQQELPELRNWNFAEKTYSFSKFTPYVIGSSPDSDPICIFSNKSEVVVINPNEENSSTYVNSSISNLAQAINLLADQIEIEVETKNKNINEQGLTPSSLFPIQNFLKKHDPLSLLENSFWSTQFAYLTRNA